MARQRDDRQHRGRDEGGQVAGDVGLDAGHAAGRQHGQPGRRHVVDAAGGVEEPLAQRTRDLAGRADRGALPDVRRRGAQQHQAGQPPRGASTSRRR